MLPSPLKARPPRPAALGFLSGFVVLLAIIFVAAVPTGGTARAAAPNGSPFADALAKIPAKAQVVVGVNASGAHGAERIEAAAALLRVLNRGRADRAWGPPQPGQVGIAFRLHRTAMALVSGADWRARGDKEAVRMSAEVTPVTGFGTEGMTRRFLADAMVGGASLWAVVTIPPATRKRLAAEEHGMSGVLAMTVSVVGREAASVRITLHTLDPVAARRAEGALREALRGGNAGIFAPGISLMGKQVKTVCMGGRVVAVARLSWGGLATLSGVALTGMKSLF